MAREIPGKEFGKGRFGPVVGIDEFAHENLKNNTDRLNENGRAFVRIGYPAVRGGIGEA